jgi:hypothetical protein
MQPRNYENPVAQEVLARVAIKLRERNLEAEIVADAVAARAAVLSRLPAGAEVHAGKSRTLEEAGIFDTLGEPGKYNNLRGIYLKMDRKTQSREIRKLVSAPDYMLGSVAAVTEDGVLVAVSATASQLGAYAMGAGRLILVVGSQKIVPDLEVAFKRIREYVLPWEDARVRESLGIGTFIGKILIIEREWLADRTTVVLVRQRIGT